MEIETVPTKPYEDQKPGTSGLRKKVKVFQQENYLQNFVQSIFSCLPKEKLVGSTFLVSGDGRYYNRQAIQIIAEIAFANGVQRLWIGLGGLMSTPAASAVIRERENGVCFAGILLTASHNPGGKNHDFGIKLNMHDGSPASDTVTEKIYQATKTITNFKRVKLPHIDLDHLGKQEYPKSSVSGAGDKSYIVEIIDPIDNWLALMKQIFDFPALQKFFDTFPCFKFIYDGLSGVAGIYASRLFTQELHIPGLTLQNCEPKEDFGNHHPDPNLIYAKHLAERMGVFDPKNVTEKTADLAGAGDGDNDRNMILGKGYFVTPSDSVAVITSYAHLCIPYFKNGEGKASKLKGVARSMPTSRALDNVAKLLGIECYETPTGWKYFNNLMNDQKLSICGEESFGTGSDHIREKDGIWAVLCWLSIVAYENMTMYKSQSTNTTPLALYVSVQQIVEKLWKKCGRNYYTRYDYEQINSSLASKVFDRLQGFVTYNKKHGVAAFVDMLTKLSECPENIRSLLNSECGIMYVDDFEYIDPVDKSVASHQGIRFLFKDGSRVVFRQSGTGSEGVTIRVYMEKYSLSEFHKPTDTVIKDLVSIALFLSQINELCKLSGPTVIT